jgi:dipeptidase D
MGSYIDRINGVCEQLQKEIREQYDEPEAVVFGEDVDALGGNALSTGDSSRVIALLCAAPNGVQTMSEDIPGLVQTSLNLGVVRLGEKFRMTFAVRSSVGKEKKELLARLSELASFHDAEYSAVGDYPAWEYRKDSALRETMIGVYEAKYGKSPEVVAIHAGLECGLFCEKIPNLDCVAMGPTAYDIHTSRERLDIASTERTYRFILDVLKAL